MTQAAAIHYAFPGSLIGHPDLTRLMRELESLDNELESQRARHRGDKQFHYQMPNMSKALAEFVELNKLDLTNGHLRMEVTTNLRKLKDHAPVIHMTFAADTDPDSMRQIVGWIRKELHPQALISVGLQPSLIGGVYVRTPNHVHDFSVRAHMRESREIIVKAIDALAGSVQQ